MRVASLVLFVMCSACEVPDAIGVVGDSIAEGSVAGGGVGYVELLDQAFPARIVANLGCGLATSHTWLEELPPPHEGLVCPAALAAGGAFDGLLVPALPLKVVFIHLGVNDARFSASCVAGYTPCNRTPVTPDGYQSNLAELLEWVEDQGGALSGLPFFVLVAPAVINWINPANPTILEYGDRVRVLCDEVPGYGDNVLCGPDLNDVMLPDHYEPGDNVHPNQAGHEAIATAFEAFLKGNNL